MPAAPAAEDLTRLSDDLDVIQRDLTDLRADGDPGLERRLQLIMQRSDQLSDDAEIRLARLNQQLAALGVAPGAEAPPEPPEIAGQRADTQRNLTELETQSRIASFLRVRAHQLLETVAARQRAAVLDIVLMETPPPWNLAVWRNAAADLAQGWDWLRSKALASAEWYRQGGPLALVQAIVATAAGAGLAGVAIRWLGRRVAAAGKDGDAAAARAMDSLRRAGIPCAALLALLLLWGAQGWFAGSFGAVLQRGLVVAILVILGLAMLGAQATAGYGLLRSETIGPWLLRGVALTLLAW